MNRHIHIHFHDVFKESEHPRKGGQFVKKGLSTGHVATKSNLKPSREGEKTYYARHPGTGETHYITHGSEGQVISHTRRYLAKSNTPNVKGQRLIQEYTEKVDPVTSETKYKRLHKALRAEEEQ